MLVIDRRLPYCLSSRADDVVGGCVEPLVVRHLSRGSYERKAEIVLVVDFISDDAGEIVFSGLLIVGDVEENREEAFAKFVKISICWLSDDCREAFGCLRKEDGNFIRVMATVEVLPLLFLFFTDESVRSRKY